MTGRRAMGQWLHFLEQAPSGGRFDLAAAAKLVRPRGLVVVLSDFADAAEALAGLRQILLRRVQLLLVQVLDPLDFGEGLSGDLRLRDSETGDMVDVRVDAEVRREYRDRFEQRRAALESFCRERGQQYLLVSTGDNYLRVVSHALRSKAVIR